MAEILLDARGLLCPLPILKAKRTLNQLDDGAQLRVLATDPVTERDFPAFCRQTGHALLAQVSPQPGQYEFLIEKRPPIVIPAQAGIQESQN
jgi:tRNA 2-thiouridine synthesizing protein A